MSENFTDMVISDAEFARLRDFLYERFGIALTDKKKSLLMARLHKTVKARGFNNMADYHAMLASGRNAEALSEFIDLVSTNHTHFWREADHFDYFRTKVLPEICDKLRRAGQLDLRVWCAACSTGDEAYTLVMMMREALKGEYSRWKAGLLATDISSRVLETAVKGIYSDEKAQMLPPELRKAYFQPLGAGQWGVKEELKREIAFRRLNLMDPLPFKTPFHVIFCRNVMIYFDPPTREALVKRFFNVLTPGGYLFIGHSESLGRTGHGFEYIMPAVYRRPERT